MTTLNFNAYDFDPAHGSAICFPLADYKVEVTGAQPQVVKDNPSAGYLELSLTVLEGELRGQVQKDRLNIFHTSDIAKRIANQQLSAYAFAMNRPYLQDTNDIIGGRLIATIGPQDDNPKYSEVKVVKCMDGSLPTRPAQQAAAAPTQTPPQAPQQPPQPPPTQPQPQAPPAWAAAQQVQPGQPVPPPVQPAAAAPPWSNSTPGTVPPWAK